MKFLCLFFIYILSSSLTYQFSSTSQTPLSPFDVENVSTSPHYDQTISIDVHSDNPFDYMKTKKDLIDLYIKPLRFKQSDTTPSSSVSPKATRPKASSVTNNKEETMLSQKVIKSISASSNYKEIKDGNIEVYSADNILGENNDNKFWCSLGNHEMNDIIVVNIDFDISYRLSSIYINWAFAPGQFKIIGSNKDDKSDLFTIIDWRYSIKNTDMTWWKNEIGNASTRWKHKSFDEYITLSFPTFTKHISILLRYPFNDYFGIYSIKFYTKTSTTSILKQIDSMQCLSTLNGQFTEGTPLVATDCISSISEGDGRNVFNINIDNTIRIDDKCLTIRTNDINPVTLESCAKSEAFGDDRSKWTIMSDGRIRSNKESDICIDVDISNVIIDKENIVVKANSESDDGNHPASNVVSSSIEDYWSSDIVKDIAVFEVYFTKYTVMLSDITISWKFPAKSFKVFVLYSDANWEMIYKTTSNKLAVTTINIKNSDINGIKIIMKESAMKVNDNNVYAINNIAFNTGAKKLMKTSCSNNLMSSMFEIIDVEKRPSNIEYNTSMSKLRNSMTKMLSTQTAYTKMPSMLLALKEKAIKLKKSIENIDNNIYEIKKSFENFYPENKIEPKTEQKLYSLGSSLFSPSTSCHRIKKSFPSKRSGYYYIKSECMANAIKVYCDFENHSKDIYLFKQHKKVLKDKNDVRNICSSIGMEPIEIKSSSMLKSIAKLIEDNTIESSDISSIVPLAYDYSCDSGECARNYRSFNSDKSSTITDIIDLYVKENRNIFADDIDVNVDVVNVFGISKRNNEFTSTKVKRTISYIVCSTNKDENEVDKDYIDLNCDDNLRGEQYSNYEIYSSLKFLCPNHCDIAISGNTVYGTDVYTDNSSICKAAIHSGIITNEGGFVVVEMTPGEDSYKGSERNGIVSKDYKGKWDKSFKVKQYKPLCNGDNDSERQSSFLEISSNLDEIKEKINFLKKMKRIIDSKKNENNEEIRLIMKKIKSDLEKKVNTLISFKQNNTSFNDERKKLIYNDIMNTKNVSSIQKIIQTPIRKSPMSTTVYINYLYNEYKRILSSLTTTKTFSDELKRYIGETISRIDNLKSDVDLGVDIQNKKISKVDLKITSLMKMLFEIDKTINNKLKSTEFAIKESSAKLTSYKIREAFIETYTESDIDTHWRVFNSKKGKGEKSKWVYYDYNIDGHLKVIKQTGSFVDSRSGSHLILRNHQYYDFELTFSVLIKDDSAFGTAFRYIDEFNYYIFEISNKDGGFKRIRRFNKGVPNVIDIKNDGGFIQNKWYYIKIRCIQNNIEVYMSEEANRNDLQFRINDNYFVSGTIAFASQGVHYLLIDTVSVVPLQCSTTNANVFSTETSKYSTLTPTCARFRETFKHGFNDRWRSIDPPNCETCPSIWKKENNVDNRDTLLKQSVLVRTSNPDNEGAIYVLKKEEKICTKGKFTISIKPLDDDGIIGIVFRYNNGNYYTLEMSKKYVRIRKKIIDKFMLVGISSDHGYQKGKWMKVILTMNNDMFNVFITKDENLEVPMKVFPHNIIDNDLLTGVIGISTYNTRALFADIDLSAYNDDSLFISTPPKNFLSSKVSPTNFERANRNILNFSWKKCLNNPFESTRKKFCNVLFLAKNDISNCENDFCKTCCDKLVDKTNPAHKYLCNKQCNNYTGGAADDSTWKSCIEPQNPERSIYNYCESGFAGDFYKEKKCKVDMCNACCVSTDTKKGGETMSDEGLRKCYEKCSDTFMKIKQK